MGIKEIPIYCNIARKGVKIFRTYVRKISLSKTPQNDEERFLLPFLLKIIKGRYGTIVRNEFDYLYANNWLPKWEEKMKSDISPFIMCDLMLGTEIVNKYSLDNEEKCNPLSEDGYKKLLFRYYCLHFFNADLLYSKNIQYKMMRFFRLVNLMVKENVLFNTYEEALSTHSDVIKDILQNTFHKESSSASIGDGLVNFHKNVLSLEDIVLRYDDWKSYSEMNPQRLQRRLYHSLCLRTTCKTLNEKLLFASFLYYWHYGFNQTNYIDIIFDGLHGEYGTDQKNSISRLFAVEKDKKVMKYFQKKYKGYCTRRGIPKESQITILLNSELPQSPTEEASIKGNNSCRCNKPNGWNKEMINTLVMSLADNQIIDKDSMSNLKQFLGFKHDSTNFKEKVIDWYASRSSIKYFICELYNKPVPNGIWPAVQEKFTVKVRGKQKMLTSSDSLPNLSRTMCIKRMGNDEKDKIDKCLSDAKKK